MRNLNHHLATLYLKINIKMQNERPYTVIIGGQYCLAITPKRF